MPQTNSSILARPLEFLTRCVVRSPRATILVAVVLAIGCLVFAALRMSMKTSRLDLISPKSAYNQRWIEYINDFGDDDDVVIVVEGARRDQVVPVIDRIAEELIGETKHFRDVLWRVDAPKFRSKGLHFLSIDQLRGIREFVDEADPIVHEGWSRLNVANSFERLHQGLSGQPAQSTARDPLEQQLALQTRSLLWALSDQARYMSPWPQMPDLDAHRAKPSEQYLLSNEGRLGVILLHLAGDKSQFAQGTQAIEVLRSLLSDVRAKHPETAIGLTGLPVMENDEMRESQTATAKAGVLSLFGVACLFIAGFGGLRHPLMTIGALLLALAWSFGYLTLAVGHLNILSVSFGVILIGLGIDFGVHYVARYLQQRSQYTCGEALEKTAMSVGPGILIGAVTTAIAFFSAGWTDFTGVAELGIIAGGGILLCAIAAMFVLPAMIQLSDHKRNSEPIPKPIRIDHIVAPLMKNPGVVFMIALALTGILASGMKLLWYDHNLLDLQAEELESVHWEKKLVRKGGQSIWYALSIAENRQQLLKLKRQFENLPTVERAEEIVLQLPDSNESKLRTIAQIQKRLVDLPERPDRIPTDPPQDLNRVLWRVQRAIAPNARMAQTHQQLGEIRGLLRDMDLRTHFFERLTQYQQQMADELLRRVHTLARVSNPEPPRLDDLPRSLVTRYVGKSGRYLLKVYSRPNINIWDMEALKKFVDDVRTIDPQATGKPLQTYEASRQMQNSYKQAAVYALCGIVLILLIDFGSFYYMLLAMVPLGLGMLQLFGLLGILGIPLNPANMIVLPLILGIGIDDGVHVVHDFRSQKARYRLNASTATAILITSLTTMVGFGSLMIASHRGLVSLGRVLTIGVSCCLFTSLVMLPALLTWLSRHREEEPEAQDIPEANRRLPQKVEPSQVA